MIVCIILQIIFEIFPIDWAAHRNVRKALSSIQNPIQILPEPILIDPFTIEPFWFPVYEVFRTLVCDKVMFQSIAKMIESEVEKLLLLWHSHINELEPIAFNYPI